jgi:hypothetical protein
MCRIRGKNNSLEVLDMVLTKFFCTGNVQYRGILLCPVECDSEVWMNNEDEPAIGVVERGW